ncbi:MAG: radical SAM protein [Acidimicrobiales bacterium]
MKVLLCSTYELGHQPLGIAGPAAALMSAGHDVETADLSLETWPSNAISRAEAIVFSIPMHTATELAMQAAKRIADEGPRPPLAFIGLYASVLEDHPLLRPSDLLGAGETGELLERWLDGLAGGTNWPPGGLTRRCAPARASIDLGPVSLRATPPPARRLLAPLDRYARYLEAGRSEVAASVESTRGCNHRCRHCPVAAVYGGRSRTIALESVLADIAQVASMGATHVSFADPDFLNRPAHALAVAHGLHDRFPHLTFDATVKVEHILRHRSLWPELRRSGLTFVVSAFESTDDALLEILDKGHTAADEAEAVAILRSVGVEVRPSWLPFTPWTTLGSLASLLEFSARADLVGSTDPVQYSIRLLLPRGSLLMADPDVVLETATRPTRGARTAARPEFAGSLAWRHRDPAIDELQRAMATLVEASASAGSSPEAIFTDLWSLCRHSGAALGVEPPEADARYVSGAPGHARPRLSEAWFCCAEPTLAQIELVRH